MDEVIFQNKHQIYMFVCLFVFLFGFKKKFYQMRFSKSCLFKQNYTFTFFLIFFFKLTFSKTLELSQRNENTFNLGFLNAALESKI